MNDKKSKVIHVVIVDDDRKTRENLADLMTFDKDIVVNQTCDCANTFFKYMDNLTEQEYPDLVLSDIDMPEMNGINMVLLGKSKYPGVYFLMLTIHDEENYLFDAIKAGASGYLLKDDKISKINQKIKALCYDEDVPISSSIARKILGMIQKLVPAQQVTKKENFNLSEREIQILGGLVEGHSYEQIASYCYISKNTVKKHVANIYHKLHVSSKAHAIKVANYYGII